MGTLIKLGLGFALGVFVAKNNPDIVSDIANVIAAIGTAATSALS